ncbi:MULTISPECIES: YgiW/YdeI family stress tolerance OB fold protein [unclassified Massilia]|uniref:YgiW/YdeI family stress tolerance OB fold protein n=1 Tax=unclassified Massilia TaxID=2609279 RepID=UPI001785288C|nr:MULTISPECIES: NirD/YgiW/YdeI family stress tolerance protein [unclassified Massilia]MBD8529544.1 NirD/YgiW/YdeI family stress tolerance protein [Massilia sp. CFBP 13647]MBD8673369.1 NirD/YgiW/YdeI family stress tolerance protein [Massilia sp. CFBP 13721]
MKRLFQISSIATLVAASAFAIAQPTGYTGPSNKAAPSAGYAGPTSVPLMTAKALLDNGKDDQYARLQGRLLSHKGGEDYEFADASGKITVEIDAKHFPAGVTIDHNTVVELTGEFDKETFGESSFDVKQLKVVTK